MNKIVNEILDYFILEIKKDENKEKIKIYLVDPTICYILDRLYPYIFITATIFIILLLIVIMILLLVIKSYYNKM